MNKYDPRYDPNSPEYVGEHRALLDKHNLRDALLEIEHVQQYYLSDEKISNQRLSQAAVRLRVAAERLDREVSLRKGKSI